MYAQKLIDEVTEELERKHSPPHQLCEFVLRQNPTLRNYLNGKNNNPVKKRVEKSNKKSS